MKLFALRVLQNNYIWLLVTEKKQCIIVDPGVAEPVIQYIKTHQLTPIALLLTHHHQDHIAGVMELNTYFDSLQIYAPHEVAVKLPSLPNLQWVDGSQSIQLCNTIWRVIATPGHTLGHVSYYSAPYLFCGDTLFSAGCGRVFEGSMLQMYQSLSDLAQLPDETLVCAAHEYTYSNLCFAATQLPKDEAIQQQLEKTAQQLKQQHNTLPSNLALEKKINLFLRCQDIEFAQQFLTKEGILTPLQLFSYFRQRKDNY